MDINKENEKLIDFWNTWFTKVKPEKINKTELKVDNELDQYLKELGDHSSRILDIGTGTGYCILTAKLLGHHVTYGLGIDPAERAIDFIQKTCEMSQIEGLEFKVGNHKILKQYPNESFDGIMSSNVLDVVPEETSKEMIDEIIRLLKPGGMFVLKLNFYLTDELIQKIQMEEIANHTFTKDGIIRGLNFTLDEWIDKFSPLKVIKTGEYERIKNGPKDRIIMFKK